MVKPRVMGQFMRVSVAKSGECEQDGNARKNAIKVFQFQMFHDLLSFCAKTIFGEARRALYRHQQENEDTVVLSSKVLYWTTPPTMGALAKYLYRRYFIPKNSFFSLFEKIFFTHHPRFLNYRLAEMPIFTPASML